MVRRFESSAPQPIERSEMDLDWAEWECDAKQMAQQCPLLVAGWHKNKEWIGWGEEVCNEGEHSELGSPRHKCPECWQARKEETS